MLPTSAGIAGRQRRQRDSCLRGDGRGRAVVERGRDRGSRSRDQVHAAGVACALQPACEVAFTQVIGAPSECERQLPGLERPEGMADFEPGTRLDELMTKSYRRTFG
jgi:hypothetical protein